MKIKALLTIAFLGAGCLNLSADPQPDQLDLPANWSAERFNLTPACFAVLAPAIVRFNDELQRMRNDTVVVPIPASDPEQCRTGLRLYKGVQPPGRKMVFTQISPCAIWVETSGSIANDCPTN